MDSGSGAYRTVIRIMEKNECLGEVVYDGLVCRSDVWIVEKIERKEIQ